MQCFVRYCWRIPLSSTMVIVFGCFLFVALFSPFQSIHANLSHAPNFKVYNSSNQHVDLDIIGFDQNQQQGLQVAAGDLNGDGFDEIVIGSGPGRAPEIRVFTGKGIYTGWTTIPFPIDFMGGVDVATGDIDGDGNNDIIAAQHMTGDSYIKVYNYSTQKEIITYFRAFPIGFSGGINVAAGDVLGDERNEIVVGTGIKNGGRVRIFDHSGRLLNTEFFPIAFGYMGGIDIAVGDVMAGGKDEIVTSANNDATARVKIYEIEENRSSRMLLNGVGDEVEKVTSTKEALQLTDDGLGIMQNNERLLHEFLAFGETFTGGANVATGNVEGDEAEEIVIAKNSMKDSNIVVFSLFAQKKQFDVIPFDKNFEGGVQVAVGDVDGGAVREIITTASRYQRVASLNYDRYVEVNLSEQRLYAYEHGILANTHLISSGSTMPTYPGTFHISQRQYSKHYVGPGYSLPNVLYNMRFDGPRWLHGTYWHNNFGHPMSHGCVNMPTSEAGWLYNSSIGQIGTPVIVHY